MTDLKEALKKEIGYTEDKPPACRDCTFSVETDNAYVDRMQDWACKRNVDVQLCVSPAGRCNCFEVAK